MKRPDLSPADRAAMARTVAVLRHRVIGAERGPTRTSLELVKNASCALLLERDLDAAVVFEGVLRQRIAHFGLQCDHVTAAADAAGRAWAGDEERRAA